MRKEERGITLVEVLAALTILSIIGVIIWNTFFQGYQFSQKAISKNFIIQETNLLITNLKQDHQTMKEYEIKTSGTSNCDITITPKINGVLQPSQAKVYTNSQICFSIQITINNINKGSGPVSVKPNSVDPNDNADVELNITASDKKDSENNVNVDTFLYRIKGVD